MDPKCIVIEDFIVDDKYNKEEWIELKHILNKYFEISDIFGLKSPNINIKEY